MAYRPIFASPHVASLAVSSVVARVPVGMTGLAFVIYVQHRTGSFGAAGLAEVRSEPGGDGAFAITLPLA